MLPTSDSLSQINSTMPLSFPKLSYITNFYFGIKQGEFKEWYSDKTIKTTGVHRAGVKDSIWVYYNEKGKKIKEEKYTTYSDVPELLKHLVFDPVYPIRLSGTSVSPLEKIFKTPAPDFELSQLTISQRDTYRFTNPKSAEILILMEGTATVHAENKYLHLSSGACFFVEAGTSYTITTSENCQLFKAKVP